MTKLSVIIPANNEEAWLAPCLGALLDQPDDPALAGTEVIVAANACTDRTVAIARECAAAFEAKGWRLIPMDIAEGGKLNALDEAEAQAGGGALVYLDADVLCRPGLLAALARALDTDAPRYATGVIEIAPAKTWITRRYAECWARTPFVQAGTVGAGLFAFTRAGRARWGRWQDEIRISDDTLARLSFTPEERVEVPFRYVWPMVEGFAALVKVRRRQDLGVQEVRERHAPLLANETHPDAGAAQKLRMLARGPVAFAVYVAVALAVKYTGGDGAWTRGR